MFDTGKIYKYIEERHLDDGGYVFYRISPSLGRDTYQAVSVLNLLGLKPKKLETILKFWDNEEKEGNLNNLNGIFFALQTYKELGLSPDKFLKYKKILQNIYQKQSFISPKTVILKEKKLGLFSSGTETFYIDLVEKEIESTYFLIKTLVDLEINFDKQPVTNYLTNLQNKNGGFGKINKSQIPSTYYALKIYNLLGIKFNKKKILNYLNREWNHITYIEDYYWWIESMSILKVKIDSKKIKTISKFLELCQKENGGFCRSQFIGIATIEDTFYAVSILRRLKLI